MSIQIILNVGLKTGMSLRMGGKRFSGTGRGAVA